MERKGKNTDLVSCLIRTLKEVQVSQVNNISFRYAMAGNQITYKCLKEHSFKPWYEYHVAVDTSEEDITNGRIDLAALLRSHFGIDETCTGSFSDITVGHTVQLPRRRTSSHNLAKVKMRIPTYPKSEF